MNDDNLDDSLDPQTAKAIRESLHSRIALTKEIQQDIKDTYIKALQLLEQAMPEKDTEGSSDSRVYNVLRNEMLNFGNRKMREVPNKTRCYLIQQVYKRETVMTKVNINTPYHLPKDHKPKSQR